MEIHPLQSFLRVAEDENISRAAETLCLSQPAVTRHILALERELGIALFDRTGRGVLLTEAGFALQRHATRVLAILDECRQEITDLKRGVSGRIVLAVGARHCVSEWLPAFQQRHPGIELVIYTRGTREVTQLILDRQVDLGLVVHPSDHPELAAIELYDEEVVLVAPPDHPFARRPIAIEELSGAPLVLWARGSDFRSYVETAFASRAIPMFVKIELDNVEEIKRLVIAGIGTTFLPESIVRREVESGRLARVQVNDFPRLTRETCVVYRSDRYLSTAAKSLIDLLREWHG